MKLEKTQMCLRRALLVIPFLALTVTLSAQRFTGGLVAGLNASQVDGDLLAGFDKLGLTGGLRANMEFESPFSFTMEFLYSERGSQGDIFNPTYDPNIEINLKYAEIPFYVSLGDWWQEEGEYYKMSAHAGLSYGRLISASTFDYYHSAEENYDKLVPYFSENDLSWLVGATWRWSPRWGVTFRYTRGIIPLLDPEKHNLQAERMLSYFLTFRFEYQFK